LWGDAAGLTVSVLASCTYEQRLFVGQYSR
jgi:hypothetical protein